MKNLIYIIICFISFCCNKTIEPEKDGSLIIYAAGDMKDGFATFDKNELSAKGSAYAKDTYGSDTTFTLHCFTYETPVPKAFSAREHIVIVNIPKKVGKYKVLFESNYKATNGAYETISGDQLINKYLIISEKDNYIEITDINTKSVKCKFQMYFTIRKPESINEPDNISFTNGKAEFNFVK